MKPWLFFAATAAFILGSSQASAAGDTCGRLSTLKLQSTEITSAELVGPNFVSPSSTMSRPVSVKRNFCRVAGMIAPSTKFEVWLPLQADWNGKLQGVGNGGMAGGISYFSLDTALEAGYAAVASDLGHEGAFTDGSFAIHAPDKVRAWGYLATHDMTLKAKALAAAFYGKAPRYSYFLGCSGGGRQGLMEAQRYPDDYDGIVAGDPTIDFSHLTTGGRLWVELSMLRTPAGAGYIPQTKIPAIAAAVVSACDALDGVADGVLEDPGQCHFKPESLACAGPDRNDCLTPPQVEALEKIYAGAKTTSGGQIYPGYMPGGELGKGGWTDYISGPAPYQGGQWIYASGFLKGMVFENPDYDPKTFNFDTDVPVMDRKPILGEKFADVINATNPDLAAFRRHGGKLIVYHGWSDPGVSPRSTIAYYERVAATVSQDKPPASFDETQKFMRLFMVPGMQHCFGGPGANAFGLGIPVPADPEHDIELALERWVEKGVPPRSIIATKYTNDDPSQPVQRTHPLCPYPQSAHFKGSGSSDSAENFACQ